MSARDTTLAEEWEVWSTRARVVVLDPAALSEAVRLTRSVLETVDAAASRFRDASELLTLHRDAAVRIPVSPLLAELLQLAVSAARLTDGAVDPTVGAALADLGYDRDIRLVESGPRPVVVVRPVPGWRSLRLRDGHLSMPHGLELDLGAVAKAYAADQAARLVAATLGTGVLVSLGGDIATAGPAPDGGWQLLVQDSPDQPASHVAVGAGTAVATSSTLHRTWRRGGRVVHHIIDPATGRSAGRAWRTVTVVAPTCVDANTLSTATIVKGLEGLAWLRGHGVPARLVDEDGAVHLVGGYPAEPAEAGAA
jgi:thiamine biosynthesis lipoprotein